MPASSPGSWVLVLVALYMLLYYRALGVVIVGVGISGALLYSIVSWMGETRGLALTLAGVTGIIVSIGVTVDSYVVFFERLKDEVKAGRTLRTSTERAFKRASAPSSPRHLVVPRRRRPVVADRGVGAGLRVLPRPLDRA